MTLEKSYSVAGACRGRILHPRDGGLISKVSSALGKRVAHHLQQRIFSKSVQVVLILIAKSHVNKMLAPP
jgi:hypothetical protein